MGDKRETCISCRNQLLVQPNAAALRCNFCGAHNPVQVPFQQLCSQAQKPVQQVSDERRGQWTSIYPKNVLSMNTHRPVLQPIRDASGGGRKKALLIGVSYRKRSYELKGSITDVNFIKFLLSQRFHFPCNSILILTEDEKDPSRIPTKQNILEALRWLINDCQSGDSLVLHYSGHSSQQANHTGYKRDGYEKTLCPVDYETKGVITDDVINETIVRPLPKGAILHAIIDSGHRGTVLDLPFSCKIEEDGRFRWKQEPPLVKKGTNGGLALCISACADNQSRVETSAILGWRRMAGALTSCFIQALEWPFRMTYGDLLISMRSIFRDANKRRHRNGLRLQEPQLSSSEAFDIYNSKLAVWETFHIATPLRHGAGTSTPVLDKGKGKAFG